MPGTLRSPPLTTALGTLVALGGCAAPEPARPAPRTALLGSFTAAEFPAAARLFEGFDPRTGDRDWQPGDRLLLGMRFRDGEEVERWLAMLTVTAGPEHMTAHAYTENGSEQTVWSWSVPVEVQLLDAASGEELATTRHHLPATLLNGGVLAAAATATSSAAPERVPDRSLVKAIFAMVEILGLVQADEVLAPYLWRVVEKPGVLSVIGNLGVQATLEPAFQDSVPAAGVPAFLPPQAPGSVVPIRIDVNGRPALFADLLAVDPRRPYALTAGVVALDAIRPGRPGMRFQIGVLAARLGDAPAR